MFSRRIIPFLRKSIVINCYGNIERSSCITDITSNRLLQKFIYTNCALYDKEGNEKEEKRKKTGPESKALMSPFEYIKKKEKETFLECLRRYEQRSGPKTDCVTFINLALKYMDEFGVNKDLEVYKKLLDLFPKGRLIPKNSLQVIFFHYIREQVCAVSVLSKMEQNGVCVDAETEEILVNTFGKWGMPVVKCHRIAYWFPKFKNRSPWLAPRPLPNETLELAKEVIKRISSVDLQTEIKVYNTVDVKDSIDETWIVSAISPTQVELLKKHDKSKAIFVEGPFRTWIADKNLEYFILRAKPPKDGYILPDYDPDDVSNITIPHLKPDFSDIILYPSVHEQNDGIIMSICATGTSTKDSLLSWIRCLQKDHPVLETIPIIFTLKKSVEDAAFLEDELSDNIKQIEDKR